MSDMNYYTPAINGGASGSYDLIQWQEAERQRRLYEEFEKERREIERDTIKAQRRAEIRLWENQEKEKQKEKALELRRAQYESLILSETGELVIRTQNLEIQAKDRQVCNFTSPYLIRLCKFGDEEEQIYNVKFIMGSIQKQLYLYPQESGSGAYLLRKFNAVGARIMGVSLAQEKRYVKELIRLLLEYSSTRKVIPTQRGWIHMDSNSIELVKKDTPIWSDYIKKAK